MNEGIRAGERTTESRTPGRSMAIAAWLCRVPAALLAVACLGACTTSSVRQRGDFIETETKSETKTPELALKFRLDYAADVAKIDFALQGSNRVVSETRAAYQVCQVTTRRAPDPVEAWEWTEGRFRATDALGIFRWSKQVFVTNDAAFFVLNANTPYPLSHRIWFERNHFPSAEFKGNYFVGTNSDGLVESPILPFTLSGEWALAWVNTGVLGLGGAITVGIFPAYHLVGAINQNETSLDLWRGPWVLVAAPVADVAVLAADTATTGGALALDVAKDAAIVAGDVAAMAGAAAVDVVWKVADLGRAAVDWAYWSGVQTNRTVLASEREYDPPLSRTTFEPVSYADYALTIDDGTRVYTNALKAAGLISVKMAPFDRAATGDEIRLKVGVVRLADGREAVPPQEVAIDRKKLLGKLRPRARSGGY